MTRTRRRLISRAEFIALVAMLAATVAFSIDGMLPVLPEIAEALSPDEPNRAQLVVASFVAGMGIATLFTGPLSDAYGRRAVAVGGAVVYILGALAAARAPNIETMLVARAIQGAGAAGPRVVALALSRDLFSGREMARVVSFVMMVFSLVPVIAPSFGALIAWAFGWRAIFYSFAVFSVVSIAWLLLRQPETLPVERRRPFRLRELASGISEVATNRQVVLAVAVQSLLFGILFSALMSSQPVFGETFQREDSFPLWFGGIAAVSASASLLNATVVMRLGMRFVVFWALACEVGLTALALVITQVAPAESVILFPTYVVWLTSVFFLAGLGIGNLNAIALEPMGHIAGMAASITVAAATLFGVVIAAPVGLLFDGTPRPVMMGVIIAASIAVLLMRGIRETQAAQPASAEAQA